LEAYSQIEGLGSSGGFSPRKREGFASSAQCKLTTAVERRVVSPRRKAVFIFNDKSLLLINYNSDTYLFHLWNWRRSIS